MNKMMISLITGVVLFFLADFPTFAGEWKQDDGGWWYQNDDGTYPAAEWQWIDDDEDGVAECYYFYSDGYMAYNNTIDDNFVNQNGQWESAGKIQTKRMSAPSGTLLQNGRDFTYAHYMRTMPVLKYVYSGEMYDIVVVLNTDHVIEQEDCYEITGVKITPPVEYQTKREAEKALSEIREQGYYISKTDFGTYIIGSPYGDEYVSCNLWNGSVFARKDAKVKYTKWKGNSSKKKSVTIDKFVRDGTGNDDYGYRGCVLVNIDSEGYITEFRVMQWG